MLLYQNKCGRYQGVPLKSTKDQGASEGMGSKMPVTKTKTNRVFNIMHLKSINFAALFTRIMDKATVFRQLHECMEC